MQIMEETTKCKEAAVRPTAYCRENLCKVDEDFIPIVGSFAKNVTAQFIFSIVGIIESTWVFFSFDVLFFSTPKPKHCVMLNYIIERRMTGKEQYSRLIIKRHKYSGVTVIAATWLNVIKD